MRSLRLHRPSCPACGHPGARLDTRSAQNLWRIPAALFAHLTHLTLFFGEVPLIRRCQSCRLSFPSET